jgi:hypothetical protein
MLWPSFVATKRVMWGTIKALFEGNGAALFLLIGHD